MPSQAAIFICHTQSGFPLTKPTSGPADMQVKPKRQANMAPEASRIRQRMLEVSPNHGPGD